MARYRKVPLYPRPIVQSIEIERLFFFNALILPSRFAENAELSKDYNYALAGW